MSLDAIEDLPPWADQGACVAQAVARLFGPYVEVAVHDLARDCIIGIWNAYSGRGVGDASLIDDLPLYPPSERIIGPYAYNLPDGRTVSSVSVVLADAAGVPRGLLCINFDRSVVDDFARVLSSFCAPVIPRPRELFAPDWRRQIRLAIEEECADSGLQRDRLSREDRLLLVGRLEARALFDTRNAATHVARALGISRSSVYNLRREAALRQSCRRRAKKEHPSPVQ